MSVKLFYRVSGETAELICDCVANALIGLITVWDKGRHPLSLHGHTLFFKESPKKFLLSVYNEPPESSTLKPKLNFGVTLYRRHVYEFFGEDQLRDLLHLIDESVTGSLNYLAGLGRDTALPAPAPLELHQEEVDLVFLGITVVF